jgi:hypothetical protein
VLQRYLFPSSTTFCPSVWLAVRWLLRLSSESGAGTAFLKARSADECREVLARRNSAELIPPCRWIHLLQSWGTIRPGAGCLLGWE